MQRAKTVRVIPPYTIEVIFQDQSQRRLNLESELWGEVFEPLRDPALFAEAEVDPEAGSVYWPTGADLSPEFLYFGEDGPPPGFYNPEVPAESSSPSQTKA